jgi:RHH-type proline utilization regulon transcriptional repressor/proline dehydrogenase/delta 1-pyrroline-5-carboxylate dehydrogenase
MGEALYGHLVEERSGAACRTYAPVGGHRDLLAYLVRRLLENGANSSFVSVAADPAVPVETLLKRPADIVGAPERARHPKLPLPRDLFGPGRRNSRGVELGHRAALDALLAEIAGAGAPGSAAPLVDGKALPGERRPIISPADGHTPVGEVVEASAETADAAMAAAQRGFKAWSATPARHRADALERAADLLEARRGRFLHLLQAEAARPSTTRSRNCARRWISAAITRLKAVRSWPSPRRCRAPRASRTG